MTPQDIERLALYFVVGYLATVCVQVLWKNRENIPALLAVYRTDPSSYGRAFGVVVLTIVLAFTAYSFAPPFLQWGWLSSVSGSNSNPVVQPILISSGHSGLWPIVLIVGVYCLLIVVLPVLANVEERVFRAGHHRWRGMLIQSFKFGLGHLLVGIPIVVGIVLVVPGFIFACRYRKAYLDAIANQTTEPLAVEAGIRASATEHSLYNFYLVSFVAFGSLYLALARSLSS